MRRQASSEFARRLFGGRHRYAALYRQTPVGNAYTAGVDADTARFLQTVAWETVQDYDGKQEMMSRLKN
jgi:hypothetical protein